MKFVFFGTDEFSVEVLKELKSNNLMPGLVVTAPDRPAGRGNKIQESAVKIWARENHITVLQPENFDEDFYNEIGDNWDLFALASYGKIIPQKVLDIPTKGTLNVHPSLLPKYRGASPIESAILKDDKMTGVTIMLMDAKMDHGPILLQEFIDIDEWPKKIVLEKQMAQIGGKLLSQTIETIKEKEILPQEQDHDMATFTKKISKEDGLVSKDDILNLKNLSKRKQREIFLKIQALNPWPSVYFFLDENDTNTRVKITEAKWTENGLVIEKVLPAGRKEIRWQSFLGGFLNKSID